MSPSAFRQFANSVPWVRFLFVDDGSTDQTLRVLEPLCREDPTRFELVCLDTNQGQGEAVRVGMNLGFWRGDRYVGFWDADLATPLVEITRLVGTLEEDHHCQAVLGSRRPGPGNRIVRSWHRLVLGRLFACVARWMLGIAVYDTQCGAKVFRNSPQVRSLFADPFHSRWIFDVEILARWLRIEPDRTRLRQCLRELPLTSWHDVAGTKLRLSDFLRAPFEALDIYLDLRRRTRREAQRGAVLDA